jgi:hypothetical protein
MRTKAGGESSLLLLDCIEVLRAHDVDYAVIGAMAAAVHGVVRASVDADVVLSLAVREVPKLRDAFDGAGFRTDLRKGDFNDPIPALLEVNDEHENRVDLLVGLRGFPNPSISIFLERLRSVSDLHRSRLLMECFRD